MKGERVVHYENKLGSAFITVNGYFYYSQMLNDHVMSTVHVEWPGKYCETVDVYMNGHFLCVAVRPHLFKRRNGD